MADPDPREIAQRLSRTQAGAVASFDDVEWLSAEAAGMNGASCASLTAPKWGLLAARSDPTTWGRAQYRRTPLGRAVAAVLTEGRDGT